MKKWIWYLFPGLILGCAANHSGTSAADVDSDAVSGTESETPGHGELSFDSAIHADTEAAVDSETYLDSATGSEFDTGSAAYPADASAVTLGGTITFTNIGGAGWWPRRLNRPNGDPACNYRDGEDSWGGVCCMERHYTDSVELAPFNEEMILILKALNVKQLAVYQPTGGATSHWARISFFDRREANTENLAFTKSGDDNAVFDGELTHDDCVWYVMQQPSINCDTFDSYYCPDDPGINHLGWSGAKMIALLGNMDFDDNGVGSCNGDSAGHPGPWMAFVAAELVRDGARKWNGLCNCYSKTNSVGDGCGEINVFEVVMDNNDYSNREFISTGIRSFQNGHVGGSVCGSGCVRDQFADDVEVVDACSRNAYAVGPVVESGGSSDGCPVFRRPKGDRFFMILLDEATRMIQVAIIHPQNIPSDLNGLFPGFPTSVLRTTIDSLANMRLP